MFRRFPFFDRLISWSKRYAPVPNKTSVDERYDWNSLWADEVRHGSLIPRFMDGTSYFPRRSEMEQGLVAFAEKTRLRVRYGRRWEATSRSEDRFVLHTSDGGDDAPLLVFAKGGHEAVGQGASLVDGTAPRLPDEGDRAQLTPLVASLRG